MMIRSSPGIAAALGAALLFGCSTPLAKILLRDLNPWLLAALLYLGSGLGLGIYRLLIRAPRVRPQRDELPWLAGALLAGGVCGPLLLMLGLSHMSAAEASLLLNAETLFTALLAWALFRENLDARLAIGLLAIGAGAVILGWPDAARPQAWGASLAVLGACLAWGIDNNLTRKLSLNDATWVAMVKGLCAGSINLVLALSLGADWPPIAQTSQALLLGFMAYGISLSLFVLALRHLGSARSGAYFAVAPFFGASLAVVLGDPLTWSLIAAGLCMGLGVWLHLTERHEHIHTHHPERHTHTHIHDAHHQHEHDPPVPPGARHSHAHEHQLLSHSHSHYPDTHHRHEH